MAQERRGPGSRHLLSFVGRTRELARLRGFLDRGARILGLVGPPGAGKTRLLQQVVRDATYVDLRTEPLDATYRALECGATTLCVDHAERIDLRPLAASVAERRGTVLITASRHHLALDGETQFWVGPLYEDDAAALWMDRLSSGTSPALVLPAFDRYPLSIEIAAELAATGDGRPVLDVVADSVPVADAIGAVPDELRPVLLACASFVSSFSQQLVEQLLPEPARAGEALAGLHVESLLARSLHRFQVPDFVRACVLATADPDARADTYRKHAELVVTDSVDDDERIAAFDRFERVDPTLAARVLLARDPLAPARTMSSELVERTASLAERIDDPALIARLLVWRGFENVVSGERAAARSDLERARRAANELGEPALGARAAEGLGLLAQLEGNFRSASEIFGSVAGSDVRRLRNLAILRLGEGDLETAMTLLEASCTAANGIDDGRGPLARSPSEIRRTVDGRQFGVSLGVLAMVYHEASRFLDARRAFERSLESLRLTDNAWSFGVVTLWSAILELDEDRLAAAREAFGRASGILAEAGDRWFSHACTGYRGVLALLEGSPEEARGLLDEATSRAMRGEDRYRAAIFGAHLAIALFRLGAKPSARDALARAAADSETIPNPHPATICAVYRALTEGLPEPEIPNDAMQRSSDLRLALRIAGAAVRNSTPGVAPGPPIDLELAKDAEWFALAGAERVSLRRRRSLRLVLERLLRARLESPGVELSTHELFEAGWPGERIIFEAGRQRVYVTLVELRKLGLGGWLHHRGQGYLLDPTARIVVR